MFVTNTEGPNAARLPLPGLLLACFTEAFAFAMGTLVGLTGLWAIPLLGLGVFATLSAVGNQRLAAVGRFTAIFFAVGVGLPGGSTGGALERLWLSLLGGLLAFLGAWLHRSLTKREVSAGASEPLISQLKRHARLPMPSVPSLESESFRHSMAVGAACALGLTVGLALGLPRDFWIRRHHNHRAAAESRPDRDLHRNDGHRHDRRGDYCRGDNHRDRERIRARRTAPRLRDRHVRRERRQSRPLPGAHHPVHHHPPQPAVSWAVAARRVSNHRRDHRRGHRDPDGVSGESGSLDAAPRPIRV